MTDTQKVILDIYKEISSICINHNIPYFAIGGTCIGAVRHKGFIPWDDDIDIAVPIEYYDSLLNHLQDELPEKLYLYTHKDRVHYHYIWAKVCNRNTTFIEKSEYKYKDAYKGVFVDIMPISGVPDGKQRSTFYKKLEIFDLFNTIRRFPISSTGSHSKIIIKKIFKIIISILPYTFFSNRYLNVLRRHPFYGSNNTGYVWHPESFRRLTFPQYFFDKTINVPFEDTLIPIPQFYDEYLSFQFGDYMKLPPIEMRLVHNGIVDLNNPYTYYLGKL